jgi:hypothetical protein
LPLLRRHFVEVGHEPLERELGQSSAGRLAFLWMRTVEHQKKPLNRARHVSLAQLTGSRGANE